MTREQLELLYSIIRYLVVGLLNTCIGLGIIYLCMYAGLTNTQANLIGYAVGIVVSFKLNKRWTFADKGRSRSQFIRFLLVTGVAYAVNLATVLLLISAFGLNPYLAQALGVVPYTAIGFVGSRWFVFRKAAG
ncbi:MAG: GtrA family protein [Steroidobacteraceae bacterium]